MLIDVNKVSITKRLSVTDDDGNIISRLYIRDKEDGKHVFLFRLKTNKAYRKKHLASELIKLAIEKYKHRGLILRACHQEGGPSTTTLIKMYRKLGFKRKGKSKTMYFDPPKVLKIGDKTKLNCPNCNSFMRVAKLSYWFTCIGAYDVESSSLSWTDHGRKCHKCGLDFVPGDVLTFKGFKTNRWDSLKDLKQWIDDINAGKGKNKMEKTWQ